MDKVTLTNSPIRRCAGATQEIVFNGDERNLLAHPLSRRSIGIPIISLKQHRHSRRRDRSGSAATNRASGGWPKAQSSICKHLQLKDGFKKSLSMSGEVGSLAGDRVVSHERSRLADLARRHRLCSRHAGSYPSHCCGCVSRCALLAYGHRRRAAVTRRERSHASGVNFESDRSRAGPTRNDAIRLGGTPRSVCLRASR